MAEARYLRFLSILALTSFVLFAGEDGKSGVADPSTPAKAAAAPARSAVPPVLRNDDPVDSTFVLLPGLPPEPRHVALPEPKPVSATVEVAERHEPPPSELADPGRPVLHRAPRPVYPEGFEQDTGIYCQKQIGQWRETDALSLLGTPSGDRPAFDDNQKANGRIYAFPDPTNRYRELELDFDGETGALRTVFVYPWKMTWTDCRRVWGSSVSAADANKGRKFYSYLNHRMDVLVDATGKVISIGLY